MDTFDPGARIKLTETFTSIGNAAITSVTLTCTVQDPAGVETILAVTPVLASPSITGTAFCTIPALNTSTGEWFVRWTAAVDIVASSERQFHVKRSYVLA